MCFTRCGSSTTGDVEHHNTARGGDTDRRKLCPARQVSELMSVGAPSGEGNSSVGLLGWECRPQKGQIVVAGLVLLGTVVMVMTSYVG